MNNNPNYRKHIGFFTDCWIHKDTKPITKEYPYKDAREIGRDFKRYIISLGYHPFNGETDFDFGGPCNNCLAYYYPSERSILFKRFQKLKQKAKES